MQPDQPNPYNNPPGHYDFIVNPEQPKRKLLPSFGGGSFIKKLAILLGGALIVIILMWIIGSMLGGSKVNTADMITLTQIQEEIVRVSDEGQHAAGQTVKNAAINTQLTLGTHQREWLELLAVHGVEVKDKELELKKDAATDAKLEQAKQSSTFDLAFTQVMETYLQDYSNALKSNFNKSADTDERALLSRHFEETQMLLEQFSGP